MKTFDEIREGVTGAVAGGVAGGLAGGPAGAAAGAYLGHKIQQAANSTVVIHSNPRTTSFFIFRKNQIHVINSVYLRFNCCPEMFFVAV